MLVVWFLKMPRLSLLLLSSWTAAWATRSSSDHFDQAGAFAATRRWTDQPPPLPRRANLQDATFTLGEGQYRQLGPIGGHSRLSHLLDLDLQRVLPPHQNQSTW